MSPRPNRVRANQIEQVLSRRDSRGSLCRLLWRNLALISCWMDGSSKFFADRLISQCEAIPFQGKGGGLYRYPLHDVVEVTGKVRDCPLIRFVGRDNQTSDLVGEKLSACLPKVWRLQLQKQDTY